jgi:hypothetical protein
MITLNTIIYEGNFRDVLNENSWFMTFSDELINNKMLTINNVSSINELNVLLDKYNKVKKCYVYENIDLIKNKYKLNINSDTLGYYYTIPYFTTIENTETEYLLNVASDCTSDISLTHNFFVDSIKELTINKKCSTTMVSWVKNVHGKIKIGEHENIETFKKLNRPFYDSEKFNHRFGFTDQFFFGKTAYLKEIDYNINEQISEQIYNGPNYGGNSFEKRMVGYQILNDVCNCVYKNNDYYIHDGHYY